MPYRLKAERLPSRKPGSLPTEFFDEKPRERCLARENQATIPLTASCSTGMSYVKQQGRKLTLHKLSCKRWPCPKCGPWLKKKLTHLISRGRYDKFVTFTVHFQEGDDPHFKARALVDAWRKLRRQIRTTFKAKRFRFLAVFERTKRGAPHLHVLTNMPYISQPWLSARMNALLQAPIVHITSVKNHRGAAAYCAKYVAKDPERFKGTKRFWRSLNWEIFPEPEKRTKEPGDPDWYVLMKSPAHIALFLEGKGFTVSQKQETYELTWHLNIPPPFRPGHTMESWAPTLSKTIGN